MNKSTATLLSCDNRKVNFHVDYSCGTAAIRGNKELAEGQHFWEIKMTSPVYGTDMVGPQVVGRQTAVTCSCPGDLMLLVIHSQGFESSTGIGSLLMVTLLASITAITGGFVLGCLLPREVLCKSPPHTA